MSLQYLLDGYNIIHQMPGAPSRLEDQRAYLIRHIELQNPQGSARNKVTVVFDGQSGIVHPSGSSYIKVVFSCDESADDKIKRMVSQAEHAGTIIVVTDDRDVQYAVRALGAQVCAVKDFLDKKKKERKQTGKISTSGPKNISKTLEHKINQELERLWLKKKQQ